MRRICVTAFVLGALCGSAFADPLQVPVYPSGNQPVYVVQQPASSGYGASQSYYYVYARHGYAAAPPAPAVPQGYAVPQAQTYGAPPPQTYAAAPAPEPAKPNGGGFLAAIFGGPTINVPVSRLFPGYPAPAQQAQPEAAPAQQQAYAPAEPQDESNYPIDPKYMRQVVDYNGTEQPGTIVVDTPDKFLYLVEDGGKALRYGIGVGRPGFTWSGVKTITAKKEWPDWTPPPDMLKRRPDLPRFMPGGLDNPLGARALYLGSTLYRIHGSNEPWTIGSNVSSGCIRMRNADVEDLYNRVKVGTKVVIL